MDELDIDKRLAPAWHRIERELGQRPNMSGSALDMRQQYKQFSEELGALYPKPALEAVEDVAITKHLAVRTYTPDVTAKDKHHLLPVGIYFHGGGWCCGDLDSEDNFCRMLAKALPLIVVSVSYRLAPEHKAPAQVRDAVDAWTWAFENAARLGGDPSKYFTIGQSAGGTLAFAVPNELIALHRGHEVKGIISLSPFVVHPSNVPPAHRAAYKSFETNANAPMNTAAAMTTFYGKLPLQHILRSWVANKTCCIDAFGADPADSSVYVLHSERLTKFPATYIAVCGADPIRDDGLIMEKVLRESGVQTKLQHYENLPHVFWAFACEPENGSFLGDVIDGIAFVLEA
ncbi:arylacetamide deacetylase [Metarhizium anisopliae]